MTQLCFDACHSTAHTVPTSYLVGINGECGGRRELDVACWEVGWLRIAGDRHISRLLVHIYTTYLVVYVVASILEVV